MEQRPNLSKITLESYRIITHNAVFCYYLYTLQIQHYL